MPGLGSSVACFVAYGEEKRRSKEPEKWGTGIVEGIAAPEAANNAVSGPSMIPLLTYLDDGSIREHVWKAYNTSVVGGEYDNEPLVLRILELRREKPGYGESIIWS